MPVICITRCIPGLLEGFLFIRVTLPMVRNYVACITWLILLQHVRASFNVEGFRCPFERRLLQATDDSDDFGDLADDVSVFQEVHAP